MLRLRGQFSVVWLAISILFLGSLCFAQTPPKFYTDLFKHMKWRQIGPAAFGGRIDDVEAVVGKPHIIFIASASGGVFKSEDNGATWKPVFDEEGTSLSIGDIAIAPTDPDIVWAGTGEPNNRQSSSWGDGVYKSIDGGETWVHLGLKETHHIGRIVIDPRNPDIVFVAALGQLWGPNVERGLFRTKDSGQTWEKILYVNEHTGAVDVAIENNGRVVYAAMYQRRRRAWGFVGGGPQSGLYRSLDGGDTWQKLTNGLPAGQSGRIGIDISKSHPNIVYAIIENKEGGVFRSEDRGKSWTRMNKLNPRPMYYSQIRVDPVNPNKIWVLGNYIFVSIDGGRTFSKENTGDRIHVDHHALWINPTNTDHLLLGGDGGFYMSYNGSKTWRFIDNLPIAQFYAIGIDHREGDPYWIYGGAQDHGVYGLPSKTFSKMGITNGDVLNVAYGDAFHVAVNPENPDELYAENQGGRLIYINLNTREEKYIKPVSDNPGETYRFGWKSPLVMSAHNPDIIYYGGNKVFKNTNQGHSWQVISPDLTKDQDWKSIPIMGMMRNENTLSRDDGVTHYGTLTSLSESPLQVGLIYAGTDDGNVQMTRDNGNTWIDLTERFRLTASRWVSCVLASIHQPGTAYVTFDGHRDNDFSPYIFKTTDFGTTWTSISGGIPDGSVVKVIREHPWNPRLLFAGTEFGLYISINGGIQWILAGGDLPHVSVDDIIVNGEENDLILGTHGRGIILLDDITLLEALDNSILNQEAYLFAPRKSIQYFELRGLPDPGASQFFGPNPEYGALFTYYLKNDPPGQETEQVEAEKATEQDRRSEKTSTVKIVITSVDGMVIREIDVPDRKGFNRISWDLRYPLSFDPEGTRPGYFEPKKGIFVLPGEYKVKLLARGQEIEQSVTVEVDPRIRTNPYALQRRLELSMTVSDLQRALTEGWRAVDSMDKEISRIDKALKDREDLPDKVRDKIQEIAKELKEIQSAFREDRTSMEFVIMDLAGTLQATTAQPTQAQRTTVNRMRDELERYIKRINELIKEKFPELRALLISRDISLFVTKPIEPPKR
ncbi:MAG: hypothetical protein WBF32_00445 [Candidatus Aminicenantaceae bacterium]